MASSDAPLMTNSPLSGGQLFNTLRVLHQAHYQVDKPYLRRFRHTLATNLLTLPTRLLEQVHYGSAIKKASPAQDPIFILGHWRTGTTHLHNLLTRDPQWGYITTFESFFPHVAFYGRRNIREKMAGRMPATRVIDGMPLDVDLPQEEEFPLANMSNISFYFAFYFPHIARQFVDCLTLDLPPEKVQHWKKTYSRLLRKTTLLHGGKPLVLKNPPNTARVKILLSLYPQAKFVYLYRDPYKVYKSTVRTFIKLSQSMGFQTVEPSQVEQLVLDLYPLVIQRFFADLPLIPAENFIAIRYEDMAADSLPSLERIYHQFRLPGLEAARPHFEAYLEQQKHYLPARHAIDKKTRDLISEAWGATHQLHHIFES